LPSVTLSNPTLVELLSPKAVKVFVVTGVLVCSIPLMMFLTFLFLVVSTSLTSRREPPALSSYDLVSEAGIRRAYEDHASIWAQEDSNPLWLISHLVAPGATYECLVYWDGTERTGMFLRSFANSLAKERADKIAMIRLSLLVLFQQRLAAESARAPISSYIGPENEPLSWQAKLLASEEKILEQVLLFRAEKYFPSRPKREELDRKCEEIIRERAYRIVWNAQQVAENVRAALKK
jgi:hypothetical protein